MRRHPVWLSQGVVWNLGTLVGVSFGRIRILVVQYADNRGTCPRFGPLAGVEGKAEQQMARRKGTSRETDGAAKAGVLSYPTSEKSKSEVVRVRVSGSELQQIEAAAEAADLTISSFIRSLSLEGAGVKPFLSYEDRLVFAALAEEFRAVGVNLNQIARAINAKREVHPDEVLMALGNVLTMMGVVGFEVRELAKRGPSRRREVM